MKKLYTLALAAIVAVTASAMAFQQAPRLAVDAKHVNFKVEEVKGTSAKKNLKKAPAKVGATLEGLSTGSRFVVTTLDLENYTFSSTNIVAGDTCDYYFQQFFYSDILDLPANVVEDPELGTVLQIPGRGQVTCLQYQGDWKLYVCALYEDEQGQLRLSYYSDMDIPFVLQDGTLYFPYTDAGMFFYNKSLGKYIAFFNPYMPLPNGTCTWTEYDQNGQLTEPQTTAVYGEILGEGDALWLCNAVMLENPITFDVAADGTAEAIGQVVVDSRTIQGQETGDFILGTTEDFENGEPLVAATAVNNEDGTSTLTWNGANFWAVSEPGYMWNAWTNCSQTFSFQFPNLPGYIENSVGNVTVDANAPVEYFNLQGVRVQNPENGLFIRRQGNSVSKVVK